MAPLCVECGHESYTGGVNERGFVCHLCLSSRFDEPTARGPGYHLADIPKGDLGEVSKIEEEFAEFMDATEQGLAVMQLVELSDLLGAIEMWLQKYHPNITLSELSKFKDVTARAFRNGRR